MVLAASSAAGAPRVAVLTMTPGPHLFERFGHTALVVGDRVYNFGTFDGEDPQLVRKFLAWRLPYWLSVGTWEQHLARYDNRRITVQEIALDDDEAARLAAALEENARPERREYRYDFFRDNCSTRVRDAIDGVAGGALSSHGRAAPGRATLRDHAEDVLGRGLVARGISLLLNASVDEPTTRWDEAFLPRELESLLREALRLDGRALVASESTIVGARFLPPAARGSGPEGWIVALLLVAIAAGALAPSQPVARAAAGGALAAWGLVAGLLGCVLVVASLTPHPCARANASLVALSPLALPLAYFGVMLALGRLVEARRRALRALLVILLVPCAIDLALHACGLARQRHLDLVGAATLVLGLALATCVRRGSSRSSAS